MENRLVGLEVALLLKEKGYDEKCTHVFDMEGSSSTFSGYPIMKNWNLNSKLHLIDTDTEEFEYPDLLCTRPLKSVAQDWLREKFNVIVDIVAFYDEAQLPLSKTNIHKPKGYFAWDRYNDTFTEGCAPKFDSYPDALEYGLKEALKLI